VFVCLFFPGVFDSLTKLTWLNLQQNQLQS
uniref:Variable lymphocyte receptor A cassette n=1 Tax=Petromyzon marinus TaxID=7757 RepID=S4S1N0_PETMA